MDGVSALREVATLRSRVVRHDPSSPEGMEEARTRGIGDAVGLRIVRKAIREERRKMNEKTAKLVNSLSGATGARPREIKRTWNRVPWPKRNRLRKQFRRIVEARREAAKEASK